MMKNIKALHVIDSSTASIFLTEALRYYCQEITGKQPKVILPLDLRSTFEKIANQYLEWEDAGIQREIKTIDAEQQKELRVMLIDEGIPWDIIEAKAMSNLKDHH